MRTAVSLTLVLLLAPVLRGGEESEPVPVPAPAPAERPAPCSTPEYRQFDFWLGEWEVVNAAAKQKRPPAHNRITSLEGGCVIREEYTTQGGYSGTSLSFFNAGTKRWHQTWIDNQGGPLFLSGRFEDGKMVLSERSRDGKINRITWRALDDRRVGQRWDVSEDGGKTWKLVFDGVYTRAGASG